MDWFKMQSVWGASVERFSDAEAGRFIKAIYAFVRHGEEYDGDGGREEPIIWQALETLREDVESFKQKEANQKAQEEALKEKRRQAAQARWNKQKDANGCKNMQNSTSAYASTICNASASQNKNIEELEKEGESDIYTRARETWIDSFGAEPTPAIIRKLLAVGLSADLTAKAIRVSAGKAPAKPVDYVLSVLSDWRRERIASEDEADEYLLLLDGAAGKLPAVITVEQARAELEQFKKRNNARKGLG